MKEKPTGNVRERSLEQLATVALNSAGVRTGPVDLFAIARKRRIHSLGLRFIVPRGMLVPVKDGFEAYVRNPTSRDYSTNEPEPNGALSPRQRFSFAHEMAHTFFFDIDSEIPQPYSGLEEPVLEDACNRLAAHLLMPTAFLRKEVADYDCIDASLTRRLAAQYQTSLEMTLERLTSLQPASPLERFVLVARRVGPEAQIRAIHYGLGLRKTMSRPAKYGRLREWLPDFPKSALDQPTDLEWKSIMCGRSVVFKKTEVGSGKTFLLQAQVE